MGVTFIIGIALYILPDHNWVALTASLFSEISLLATLEKSREKFFSSEYGASDCSISPPSNEDHHASRYLIFRKKLRENSITKSHIEDAIPLVNAKIDIEANRSEFPKKYFGFALALLAGIIASWSKNLDPETLAITIASFLILSFFIIATLWIIPSRTERLKELKYFMLIYQLESE